MWMKFGSFQLFLLLFLPIQAREMDSLSYQLAHMQDDTAKVLAYGDLASSLIESNPELALDYLNQMQNLSKKLNYRKGLRRMHFLKAGLFLRSRQVDSTKFHYRQFNSLLEENTADSLLVTYYANMGLALNYEGEYDSSIQFLNKALEKLAVTDSSKQFCTILNSIGLNFYYLGNLEKSLDYFHQSFECFAKLGKLEQIASSANNIAAVSFSLKKENADSIFLSILQNELKPETKATIYLNLGIIQYKLGKTNNSLKYLTKADSIFSTTGKRPPELLHAYADLYILEKDFQQALSYYEQILSGYPAYAKMDLLFENIASLHFKMQQYDSARKYYEKALAERHLKTKETIEETLSKTKQNLSIIQKNAQLRELNLENKLLQSSKERNRIFISSLLIVILLILLLGWLYFHKEKERRKVKEFEVREQARKLDELKQKIHQRNVFVEEIEKKINKLQNEQNIQKELKSDILETFGINGDLDTFLIYFKDQHQGFYEKLRQISAELTDNDLRICSLSKLRLSLKETANVLNISADAVKSSRYRIRKKLNVDTDQKLSDFLNEIS